MIHCYERYKGIYQIIANRFSIIHTKWNAKTIGTYTEELKVQLRHFVVLRKYLKECEAKMREFTSPKQIYSTPLNTPIPVLNESVINPTCITAADSHVDTEHLQLVFSALFAHRVVFWLNHATAMSLLEAYLMLLTLVLCSCFICSRMAPLVINSFTISIQLTHSSYVNVLVLVINHSRTHED